MTKHKTATHRATARRRVVLALGAATVATLAMSWSAQAQSGRGDPDDRCQALFAASPPDTTITGAAVLPESEDGLPRRCRVTGYVRPAIHFELSLPIAAWNEKFYMVGCGHFCGRLESRGGRFENAAAFGLRRGYATIITDAGHWSPSETDARWAYDARQAEIDWGRRAAPAVALVGQVLTELFYPEDLRFSYFAGCGTGGRMGLTLAVEHPDLFDGIVAGAPILRPTAVYGSYFAWLSRDQHLRDSTTPLVDPERLEALADAVLASCDPIDGLADGLITDPRQCPIDQEALTCPGDNGAPCVPADEAAPLWRLYARPTDDQGETVLPYALPPGSERYWADSVTGRNGTRALVARLNEQFLRYMAFEQDPGPTYPASDFFFERDSLEMRHMARHFDLEDTDLSAFAARGGRLILYHGWADTLAPHHDTIAFYEAATRPLVTVSGDPGAPSDGAAPEVIPLPPGTAPSDAARLFMVPGMDHCRARPGLGPDEFDMLTPLEAWVERGETPERVIASEVEELGGQSRSRPLCPHPRVARFNGGDASPNEADSFTCGEPGDIVRVGPEGL